MVEALIVADVGVPASCHALLPYVALSRAWIGSLGNGFSGESMLFYMVVTLIVLVALVIALAALIKYEIGREGGEGEGGASLSTPPSPPSS